MTAVFPARRAEEFNDLVEGTSTTQVRDARVADLLDLVAQLRDVTPVQPRAEFSASLREELMAAADTLLLPSADTQRLTLPPRRTARDRRIAAVVGGFAVVGATTSLAVAAQGALPGEMLYPIKRAMESAETGFHTSDEGRGASLLGNATDRLAEVTALSQTGGLGQSDNIAATLTTFSDQALEASDLLLEDYAETGDEGSVQELRDFTGTSMQTLGQLDALLPEGARDELAYAAQVLGQIDAAAAQACPACTGGITQIPSVLLAHAGAVPEPDLVVVPSPVFSGGSASGDGQTGGKGSKGGTSDGSKGGKGSTGSDDEGPLAGTPLAPSTGGGTGGDTGGGAVGDLLGGLTGSGDQGASNGGGTGVDPLDDVVDTVDETVDEILPGLGG